LPTLAVTRNSPWPCSITGAATASSSLRAIGSACCGAGSSCASGEPVAIEACHHVAGAQLLLQARTDFAQQRGAGKHGRQALVDAQQRLQDRCSASVEVEAVICAARLDGGPAPSARGARN